MPDRGYGAPLPPAEPRYRRVLITWLAIFPLVTTVLAAGEPLGLGALPLIARSVVITAIVVPLAVLWVIPALRRAFLRSGALWAGGTGEHDRRR
jgi:antibiotic biosynthesis monooxygenase (ABM) superfamily enzyme